MTSDSSSFTSSMGLRFFSAFVAGSVVFLITVGAQVTSNNAGMSVPDWPTSYGYNMFTFPIQRWVGGIAWEHVHRLVASGVGMLTVALMIWIWTVEKRRWLRGVAAGAVGLVVLQGVVGGLRVRLNWDDFGILHAALAQLFLIVTGFIALTYTKSWLQVPPYAGRIPRRWQRGIHLVAGLIFLQLILGAVMRHQHAGLSIPDFPLAYGHLWPHVTRASLPALNDMRVAAGQMPTTLVQIHLQMMHRILAFVILIGVFLCGLAICRCRQSPVRLRTLALFWMSLVVLQVVLGAATIWSGRTAAIASAHVVTGALLLLIGSHMAALVSRWRRSAVQSEGDREQAAIAELAPSEPTK